MSHFKKQAGFTIIELTLATAVFSIILLVIAAGILNFTRSYLKGVHQSQTQEVARQVMDEVSQALQYSASYDTGSKDGWKTVCFGTAKYSYRVGTRFTGTAESHALIRSPNTNSDCEHPVTTVGANDAELLGNNMRLQTFSVTPLTSNTYSIDLRIVYGDDDLSDGEHNGERCLGGAGSQFCAAAQLHTTVQQRL